MKRYSASALVLTLTVALASGITHAGEKAPGSAPNPFSDCGIGAALFPDTHWAAVLSNVIWDLGTTAVTSATMSPETCSGKNVKAALLIRDTYAELAEDVARGQGEHLAATLSLFECGTAARADATADVRASMARTLADPAYDGKSHLEKSADFYAAFDTAARTRCVG